jgi:hypothetical protein
MTTPGTEIPEPTATPVETQTPPRQNPSPDRVADKRADVLRAKKKKKRDAHRVALRRSHTKG